MSREQFTAPLVRELDRALYRVRPGEKTAADFIATLALPFFSETPLDDARRSAFKLALSFARDSQELNALNREQSISARHRGSAGASDYLSDPNYMDFIATRSVFTLAAGEGIRNEGLNETYCRSLVFSRLTESTWRRGIHPNKSMLERVVERGVQIGIQTTADLYSQSARDM